MPGEVWIDRRLPENLRSTTGTGADVQSKTNEPSYYDVSMLKAPVWEGHYIGPYFFLGGLSGAAYLLARMADLFGGREYRDVSRAGSTVALLSAACCPPLLIKDLGDPSRFHHMLRVFKPSSPMNLGSWVLTGFSGAAAAAVMREWLRGNRSEPSTPAGRLMDKSLAVVTNGAGIPLALVMTCYTGVLLSGTATPLWCRNPWLAPLFSASAIGNGSGAISLALQLMRKDITASGRLTSAEKILEKIDTAAHVAEVILLVQYLNSLGRLGKPLLTGKCGKWMAASVGGLVAGEVLKRANMSGRAGRWARLLAGGLNLGSGLALKYAILEAGKPSANDPSAARIASSQSRFPKLQGGGRLPAPKRPAPTPGLHSGRESQVLSL